MVTLIELKKAKRMALKNHDENAQDVLGVMIGDYQKAEADKEVKARKGTMPTGSLFLTR